MPKTPFDSEHDYRPPSYSPEEIQALHIRQVHFLSEYILFLLSDGKVLCLPLSVCPLLAAAAQEERYQWQLVGEGRAVRWYTGRLEVHLKLEWLLQHPDAHVGETAEVSSPFPPL